MEKEERLQVRAAKGLKKNIFMALFRNQVNPIFIPNLEDQCHLGKKFPRQKGNLTCKRKEEKCDKHLCFESKMVIW